MKNRPGEKIKLASLDELLGVVNEESAMEIEINKIHAFKNHPFKVLDDEKMQDLIESVKLSGVLTPILLRVDSNDEYEMISGHRRLHAAKMAGLNTIPAIVRELSDDVMIPEVSSIGVLIDEMYQKNILMLTPDEREMLQETLQESSEMPTFFVVTNTERIDGAGVIFYPEFMDNMGELLGNDFFILPSSIHEMLVLPDDGQVDAEMLRDMVKEVNATQVAPAERLTNDVYHFDTKDHVFEKADRFTERQKEKEAQAAKTEKAGKEQPDKKPKAKKHDMEL